MVRPNFRALLVVALTVVALLVLLGGLATKVGRPYPGFFVAPDFRVFPAEPDTPLRWGDRIVSVDGRSPIVLEARVAASGAPIRYDIERAGSRLTLDVAPRPFTWRTMSTPAPPSSARPRIEGRAGTRWTYTASGMTTNIAARLAAQAQGGEIVLSGETRARLGVDLELEDVGLRELKGVERPVPLYRLR